MRGGTCGGGGRGRGWLCLLYTSRASFRDKHPRPARLSSVGEGTKCETMRRGALVFGALTTALVVGLACSSSSSSDDYDGPRTTTCSTGPAWGLDTQPPAYTGPQLDGVPECVPRCGAEAKLPGPGFVRAVAALPSGTCQHEGEPCGMAAAYTATCNGVTQGCDLSTYQCRCESGNWRCYVTSQGGGVCAPCFDAGALNGDAAAADAN